MTNQRTFAKALKIVTTKKITALRKFNKIGSKEMNTHFVIPAHAEIY